jgi:hypothetical protein
MDKIMKDNAYAKGVVEMACVDLTARSFGVSAAALFGGAVRERIPTLWVLGTGDAAKDIAEAEEKMAAGLYKLFLVKIGKGDPRDNVARAAAVKQALGDRARVHVDINQSWNETPHIKPCIAPSKPSGASSPRVIAGLTRLTHDVGLAEDLAQEALVAALEPWPQSGVPDNPAAWLTATANR